MNGTGAPHSDEISDGDLDQVSGGTSTATKESPSSPQQTKADAQNGLMQKVNTIMREHGEPQSTLGSLLGK